MTRHAAIYLRISRDATDRGEGVDRQREDCLRLAERLGLAVSDDLIFSDNDVSASTSSRKPRPEYEAMLAAIREGRAQVLLAYSNSRLTRRVREYLDLIDLHRETGVLIKTCVSGDADLSTADGRNVALILASNDQAEAERTSERITRQRADRAARGLPQGGRHRLYGYTREWALVLEEAEVLRDLFRRRAAGSSVTSLARDLDDRGLTTSSGAKWTSGTLAKILANPLYCGLRSYRGEIIGKSAVPIIVDEPTWRAAQAAKSQPGTNARRWLLSGILRCSRCGGGMIGNGDRGGYRCNKSWDGCGNTVINVTRTDDAVASLVLAREGAQRPSYAPDKPTVDLGALDQQITDVQAALVAGDLALEDASAVLKGLRAKRREAESSAVSSVRAWGPLVTHDEWMNADLSARRALIGRHVDTVTVHPGRANGGRYDVTRLVIRWHGGTNQQVTEDALRSIPYRDSARGCWRIPRNAAGEWVGLSMTLAIPVRSRPSTEPEAREWVTSAE